MVNSLHNNKRLAKNTLYLYFRTFLVMVITIFTSRIVLDSLGIENYGIYNIVGGFVSMFAVLSGTLTAASQRFIAFELGKEKSNVKRVFSATLTIHFLLAILIFIILESLGLWFLNEKMNISSERMYATNWVFQCSVITFCINIISIPYRAAIIAYEKMSVFALVSIFEVLVKLGIAYVLYIISYDVLIVYAILMLLVSVLLQLIYGWYCKKAFKECRYCFLYDKKLYRDMLSFSGWNFIGSTAGVLNGQGINVLINLFFGVTYNAAKGIATQVETALNAFVQNFIMALNPQITKAYAERDFKYVNKMLCIGTKLVFYLFLILCLPVFFNVDYILRLWLKQVPEYAALFIKYGIVYSLCQCLSQCLYITMLATGHIKKYQIIVGTLSMLAFPMTFFFFKLGLPCEYGYVSMILFSLLCFIARVYLLKDMVPNFSVYVFVNKALFPIIYSIFPIIFLLYYLHIKFVVNDFITFAVNIILSVLISLGFILFFGVTRQERLYLKNFIRSKVS